MGVSKDKQSTPEESAKADLTPKQIRFCELYATDREFFGNGVQSYAEAYGCEANASARVNASKLLTNANILTYINEILETGPINDAFADKQLGFLMTQNADKNVKLGAIKHYSDLKQRVTQKVAHEGSITVNVVNYGSDDNTTP